VADRRTLPCALAIGGLDPGGGAGLAADLRAVASAGAFGCAVAAVLTVQSTGGLRSVRALAAREVLAQAREVLDVQRVRALKTGALGSAANVRAVGDLLAQHASIPAVVDPVMSPTRGQGRLLATGALAALRESLIPRAALVTANAPEAEALTGAPVESMDDAREAARALCRMGTHAALVKAGHMRGGEAVDVLALASGAIVLLSAPRLRLAPLHGGGCTLASLIAGRLACDPRRSARSLDARVVDAVRWAKRVHHAALRDARDVGGAMRVLVP
jgi:hydroxymethylpyrimidine/phosphomethylpyrimidine kinase